MSGKDSKSKEFTVIIKYDSFNDGLGKYEDKIYSPIISSNKKTAKQDAVERFWKEMPTETKIIKISVESFKLTKKERFKVFLTDHTTQFVYAFSAKQAKYVLQARINRERGYKMNNYIPEVMEGTAELFPI